MIIMWSRLSVAGLNIAVMSFQMSRLSRLSDLNGFQLTATDANLVIRLSFSILAFMVFFCL